MSDPLKRTDEDTPAPGNYYVSASQLGTYWECNRKWAWSKLRGLKEGESKGAALGSLMHDQLEKYLRDGRPLDFLFKDKHGVHPAEIAAAGLQYLPAPQSPGLQVERYFKFPVPEQPHIFIRGFKDYTMAPEYREDGLPHVGDHKSCGNAKYALTADELQGNVQAIIYAYDELLKYPDAPAATLQWTYYATKGRRFAWPVCATVTRAHVLELMQEVFHGAIEVAVTFLSKPDPLSLPYNADSCDKYGGCPFIGNCNLGPRERQRYSMSNDVVATSNLIDRMNARKEVETGVPAVETVANPDMSSFEARLAARLASKPTVTEVAPPALPVSDQPINCPTDFQPPPTSDAARATEEAEQLADIVPVKVKAVGRPRGSKNAAVLETPGVDPVLVNAFLVAATRWFNHCYSVETTAAAEVKS
jgi:PD-(D/E)XK nuclease superfamily protein